MNHRTAPVEIREKLYLHDAEAVELLGRLRSDLSECVILSTCNRTEFYGVTEADNIDPNYLKNALLDFKGVRGDFGDEHFFSLISCAACQHLFSVATSIDSQVVGDSQILRQLRKAYSTANHSQMTGKVINQLMQRAFKIGKRTFTDTSLHSGAVSISLAAVELALETYGSLRGRSALLIGSGETGRLTAEALCKKGIGQLLITNRTRSVADELAVQIASKFHLEAEVIDFDAFASQFASVDIAITSTGSNLPIVHPEHLVDQPRDILLIDIAVPRDVDAAVSQCERVTLKNIDDLHSIIDGNYARRKHDLPKAKKLVMTEMVEFLTWYYSLAILPETAKTRTKPPREVAEEFLKVKAFLNDNISEIHKLAAGSGRDFQADMQSHISLVRTLRERKASVLG
ncbi:MAG: glutamyl-tRNA reductase [Blastocatellia bacterium]|nr:glutamyl-tRNA reductase [Blastocatellia bacterium]